MSEPITFNFTSSYPLTSYPLTNLDELDEAVDKELGTCEDNSNQQNQEKIHIYSPPKNPSECDLANQKISTLQKISTIFDCFCVLIIALGNYMLFSAAIGFAIGGLGGAKIGACTGLALFSLQMLSVAWSAYKIHKHLNT